MTPAREYRDIAQFGLHLVPPDDDRFPALLREIQARPQPFPAWPAGDVRNAAVLLNQSGRNIVVLGFVWRYTSVDGTSRSSRYLNLGSSMQMEILTGRSPVPRDLGTCILTGSKRLLTEQGMFGNNLDVLPEESIRHGSYPGAGGGRAGSRGTNEQITSTQLSLDLAVLDNGLCVGPDTEGVAKTLSDSLEVQRSTAEKVAAALQNGASDGQVFEMLLPCARQPRPPVHGTMLLVNFGRMAIDQLINSSRAEQLAFFQKFAQPPAIRLHRP